MVHFLKTNVSSWFRYNFGKICLPWKSPIIDEHPGPPFNLANIITWASAKQPRIEHTRVWREPIPEKFETQRTRTTEAQISDWPTVFTWKENAHHWHVLSNIEITRYLMDAWSRLANTRVCDKTHRYIRVNFWREPSANGGGFRQWGGVYPFDSLYRKKSQEKKKGEVYPRWHAWQLDGDLGEQRRPYGL